MAYQFTDLSTMVSTFFLVLFGGGVAMVSLYLFIRGSVANFFLAITFGSMAGVFSLDFFAMRLSLTRFNHLVELGVLVALMSLALAVIVDRHYRIKLANRPRTPRKSRRPRILTPVTQEVVANGQHSNSKFSRLQEPAELAESTEVA